MEGQKTNLYKVLTLLGILLAVLVLAKIVTEVKGYRFIGGAVPTSNTISVSGQAEVYGTSDIATVYFSVREEAKKVAEAQTKVNDKVKASLEAIRKIGIEDKDIKTQNYSSYPKYEYQEARYSCMALNCPPPTPGKNVLVGYEASQSVTLTIRDLDKVSAVIEALGVQSVTDIQGPTYAIDKEDQLKAEARKEAIKEARDKAESLADDLGVSIIRVVSFSEDGYYPVPMYSRTMGLEKADMAVGGSSEPELPQGQEKISSNVTITYEIR